MRFLPKILINRVRGKTVSLTKKGTEPSKILRKARQDTLGIRKAYKSRKKTRIKYK